MGWSTLRPESARYPHSVDDLLEATNATFERARHTREANAGEPTGVTASRESVGYVEAFWAHVGAAIAADTQHLGTSVQVARGSVQHTITVAGIRAAMLTAEGTDNAQARIKTAALAPLVVMSQILEQSTSAWAGELRSGRCPLAFDVDATRYVSLRALLPKRDAPAGAVGGNAPTLVMGGTATALAMCWNLLLHLPRAYDELEGHLPDRATMEALWAHTRELVFRIGGGSLTAFVALASACSSNAAAMLWDGAGDLGLARRGERYVWMMNARLQERYAELLATVIAAQQGEYVGCAALYARARPLPLAAEFADAVDTTRPAIVFNEILRWITAVARAEYFPVFDVPD